MNLGWVLFGGLIGFFLARWLRARADVAGTADSLKSRIGERRQAALWVIALAGGLILYLYSKGSSS